VIENELKNAMKAELQTSNYLNSNYRQELEEIEQSEGGLVECEVCDRSHLPNHPHITKIEGDISIDDPNPDEAAAAPAPEPPRELPDWLRDKPAADVAEDDKHQQMCKLCGKPWAPRHDCNPAVATAARAFNGQISKYQTRCDTCGKIKRSNHNCKAQPKADTVEVAERCGACKRAGELCVRHGGVWSSYDRPKVGDERIAKILPAPVSVTQSETTGRCRNGHPKTPGERIHPV
jgi:hypothetical protein